MKENFNQLIEKYGPFGAIEHLRQYDNGSGDYTKERGELLKDVTMDDIKREIAALSAGKTSAPAAEKEGERVVSEGFVQGGVARIGYRGVPSEGGRGRSVAQEQTATIYKQAGSLAEEEWS